MKKIDSSFLFNFIGTGRHSQVKGLAGLIIAVLLNIGSCLPAAAQCDTFYNADAANLIKKVSPYNQFSITGVAFADIDNDGDLDCYFGSGYGSVTFIENHGNGKHPQLYESADPYPYLPPDQLGPSGAMTSDMEFADIDGDGDLDYFNSQYGYSRNGSFASIIGFENTGTPSLPYYSSSFPVNPIPAQVYGNLPLSGGVFTFYDVDKDGDFDFTFRNINGAVELYMNMGCKTSPNLIYYGVIANAGSGKPQYYDWNRDGLPDLLIEGQLYLNTGTLAAPVFTASAGNAPVFSNGAPFILTDVNADGALEAYTFDGHLSAVTAVPVIDTTVQMIGNRAFVKYYSAGSSLPGETYSWVYNGKRIAGYHKPFIYAEKKGAYSLEITNGCGTGVSLPHLTYDSRYSSSSLVSFTLPGASLPRTGISVKAYPNPFRSQIQVQLPEGKIAASYSLQITDLAGRTLETVTTASSPVWLGSRLHAGMYILQVWQNGQLFYHTSILKE